MILAAADCGGDPRRRPPPELIKAQQAVFFRGSLPRAGGLEDQPAGLLDRMNVAYNVWLAFHVYRQRDLAKDVEWREDHPDLWGIIQRVNRLREASSEVRHGQ